jgi:hypothetical protein
MICEICGKEFFEDWRKDRKLRKNSVPRFCSRSCSNKRKHSKSTKEKIKKGVYSYLKENGLDREKKHCKKCGKLLNRDNKTGYCKEHYRDSFYYRSKLSQSLRKSPFSGGYRERSGRGKSGYYKGYYSASTWELAYIIYLLDNDISFNRNNNKYEYFDKKGNKKKYIPDFVLEDGTIVEIKGPQDKNWEEKLKYFPYKEKLVVLTKEDIYPIIQEIKNRYDVNHLEYLYEDIENKKCEVCDSILSKRNKTGYCKKHVLEYVNNYYIKQRNN